MNHTSLNWIQGNIRLIDYKNCCKDLIKFVYKLNNLQAHGMKGVLGIVANPRYDQLITAGLGKQNLIVLLSG